MKIRCLIKGCVPITKERKKEILHTIKMYELDILGTDAFSNLEKIKELEKEIISCIHCGENIKNVF